MLLPSVFSSFRRLGVTFRNARPVEIVGEFLFYTGGHLFGMKSNHTAPRENEVRGHIPAPYDSFFNLFESSRHAVKVSHGLLHCTPAPITSSFSCIQESAHVLIFHISSVRMLSLKIRVPYFHFTRAHTQRALSRRHFPNFSFDTLC